MAGSASAVQQAGLNGEHKRHLVGEPQRRVLRLIEDRADARAARELLAHARIRHAAEAGEHFQFEELGIVEPRRVSAASRSARAWVLPPTRLTLTPTSTAGFWPS